jgi:hypothetical protein
MLQCKDESSIQRGAFTLRCDPLTEGCHSSYQNALHSRDISATAGDG